jgi:hypothetical protein
MKTIQLFVLRRRLAGALIVALLPGCAGFPLLRPRAAPGSATPVEAAAAEAERRARAAVPPEPFAAPPGAPASRAVWRDALAARGTRIVVSTADRALWLMRDSAVLLGAPVAVGMHEGFTYAGRRYDFRTPVGRRKVLAKGTDPIWVPPDWHYYELVVQRGLIPVRLKPRSRERLADGTHIEVRGDQVGRVNQNGYFAPFTPGVEIIFDGRIFIPPFGTAQRRVPEVLGTHKLEMGDGYLIHGTPEEDSIGEAVSHGCVRMYNVDVARLYALVPVGTEVFIY